MLTLKTKERLKKTTSAAAHYSIHKLRELETAIPGRTVTMVTARGHWRSLTDGNELLKSILCLYASWDIILVTMVTTNHLSCQTPVLEVVHAWVSSHLETFFQSKIYSVLYIGDPLTNLQKNFWCTMFGSQQDTEKKSKTFMFLFNKGTTIIHALVSWNCRNE